MQDSRSAGFDSVDDCLSDPDHYKFCSSTTCVPTSENCPCQIGEIQCTDGHCLPYHLVCQTDRRCRESDAVHCLKDMEKGLPDSAVAAIVSASAILCVLLFVLLCLFFLRRQRNNTSRESQAALDPLQEEKISDEMDYTYTVNRNFKTRHKHSAENNIDKTKISQNKCSKSYSNWNKLADSIICFENENDNLEYEKSYDRCFTSAIEQNSSAKTDDITDKCNSHIHNETMPCQETSVELNRDTVANTDQSSTDSNAKVGGNEESQTKYGKYIYKPRSRKPPVIYHSYLPSHTEPSTPTSVDFDGDKISFLFAQEFLCASTPKQTAKQLVFHASPEIGFIDE